MAANDGKYLEKAVQSYLENLMLPTVNWMRLPDSKAARNFLQAQPADFLISTMVRKPFLFECKSYHRKKSGAMTVSKKFRQYPLMLRWDKAGMPGYLLCHWLPEDELKIFSVIDLATPLYDGHTLAELPDLMEKFI
jgi:hypothetical protein